MNLSEAINYFNELGKAGRAFLFLVDFELTDIQIWPLEDTPDYLLYDFQGNSNYSNFQKIDSKIQLYPIPPSKTEYKKAFQEVSKEIQKGNSFLLNLTGTTKLRNSLDLKEIFFAAKAPYKLLWKDRFCFFSPEKFVQIAGNKLSTYPMKGTIDAAIPQAAEKILNDPKEMAEHNTIVDLLRNDISQIARNVRVKKLRYIEKICSQDKSLLQVSSEIEGNLKPGFRDNLGTQFFKLLPAGSISGAPKPKTIEIIQKAESSKRSYYTGVAGIYDGQNLDSCVMIRYIEKERGKLYFRSGGGITFMSDPDKEYKELLQKIYVPLN